MSCLVFEFLASFLGGILSFILSRHLASSNPLILWFGENPLKAVWRKSYFLNIYRCTCNTRLCHNPQFKLISYLIENTAQAIFIITVHTALSYFIYHCMGNTLINLSLYMQLGYFILMSTIYCDTKQTDDNLNDSIL